MFTKTNTEGGWLKGGGIGQFVDLGGGGGQGLGKKERSDDIEGAG